MTLAGRSIILANLEEKPGSVLDGVFDMRVEKVDTAFGFAADESDGQQDQRNRVSPG